MADLAVELVVAELLKAAMREVALAAKHKNLFKELLQVLHTIQSFLSGFNSDNIDTGNEFVQGWIKDLEVCLVEAKTLATKYQNASWSEKFIMPRAIVSVMEKMKNLIQNQGPLVNASQGQALLNRVKEMSTLQRTRQHFIQGSSSTEGREADEDQKLHQVPEKVFGIEDMAVSLEHALLSKEPTKWIGVWGKGGVGKTLISQVTNNNPKVQAHFKGSIYWLTVSQNPVVASLLQILLSEMRCPGETGLEQEQGARNKLYNHCRNQRVLLILDDVWDAPVLEQLDVVDASAGSKILVTTRKKEVFNRLEHCTLLEVIELSPENSWDLFRSHAFPGVSDVESMFGPEVNEVAREVAAECKGLPLALKVIGSTMAGKHKVEWRSCLRKLKEAGVISGEHETEVIRKLKLSYDKLLSVGKERGQKLQTAFLYFAAFKEDYYIDPEELIRYWWGEGLIGSSNVDDGYEDAGYSILCELEEQSLIQVEEKSFSYVEGDHVSCKIHDVLRDMAIYILEHNREIEHRTCLFQAGKNLSVIPDKWYVDSGHMAVERVSLAWNELKELSRPLKAPMLKVLLLDHNKELGRIRSVFLRELRNLRVLDLSFTNIETLPKGVSNLVNLAVLELRNCVNLRTIAKGIIGKLVKLEYINMYLCLHLQSFPFDDLGKLVRLRHLKTTMCGKRFQLGSSASKINRCLFQHARLRNLCTSLPNSLESLGALHTLSLEQCYTLEELPNWLLTSFPRLEELTLIDCSSLRGLPRGLERLKALKRLELSGTRLSKLSSIPEEWGEPDAFPCLEFLTLGIWQLLDRLPELQPGAMRRLSTLMLVGCKNLKEIPETLLSLETLRELHFVRIGITTLPASIARLPSLSRLYLDDCKHLEMLPVDWEDSGDLFPTLVEISLEGSGVKKLSRGLANAPELKWIGVEHCREELYEPELFSLLNNRKLLIKGWLSGSSQGDVTYL